MNKFRIAIACLSLSASAFVGLLSYEGYCGSACIPVPGDVPTLGFGTTEGVHLGDTITPPRAVSRALKDVNKYEGAIKRCVKVPLHQHEYDAYTQLAYNIGPTAFCKKAKPGDPPNLVDLINAERYEEACARIDAFNKFKGKPLRGLTIVRAKERALCEGASQ